MLLQIIHIRESHWAAIKMVDNKEVLLYDSAYTTISMDTVDIITKLIHSMESAATIHVMNVAKQAGMTDCALFAMATITCLALGTDPLAVVHDQQELRSHLLNILVTGKVTEFPTNKKRRIVSQMRRTEEFQVYCYCRMRYDGTKMVCCDNCDEWYHLRCINTDSEIDINSIDVDKWFCKRCS